MPGYNGTGPMGMGPMTGGGRGLCNPRGARANPALFRFPRRAPFMHFRHRAYGTGTSEPHMSREQELESLKGQAKALQDELKALETEIEKLSAVKE